MSMLQLGHVAGPGCEASPTRMPRKPHCHVMMCGQTSSTSAFSAEALLSAPPNSAVGVSTGQAALWQTVAALKLAPA
eukprot:1952633-Karenia_brevis.AAC.1